MLISILVATLFLGGGSDFYIFSSNENIVKRITVVIEDKDQQEEVLAVINQTYDDLKDYNKQIEQIIKNGQILNSNYQSTTEDFEYWIGYLTNSRERFLDDLEDMHFSLVDKMTKEQWESIVIEEDKD